jgi:anthranilate phosphoribosyltransferase
MPDAPPVSPDEPTAVDRLGGWPALLGPLMAGTSLTADQTTAAMSTILDGMATHAQTAAFIVALRQKGETVEELSGLLRGMLAAANLVTLSPAAHARAIDIVGTGGDRSHSINVSTTSMFVLAGGGVTVCKHGSRAASSACGAADLLAELGVRIELSPQEVSRCVDLAGFAFCFAPLFHPALRHAGPVRREIGVQTSFNVLGPMSNPARVSRLMVGVADPSLAEKMIHVMAANGAERVMIVHGDDGIDEITTTSTTSVWEYRNGSVVRETVDALALGLPRVTADQLRGGSPEVNAGLTRAVLNGAAGPHRDIVVLNAAAGFYLADSVPTIAAGIELAAAVIDDGRAAAALDRLVSVSHAVAE